MTKVLVARDRTYGNGRRRARTRVSTLGVLVAFVATACSGLPNPSGSQISGTSFPTPDAPSASAGASAPPVTGGGGGTMTVLPSDIVGAVDRLTDASTDDERIAAAGEMLAAAGVTISGDDDAAPENHAGLVLAPEEVATMAVEAANRDSYRATLADFAEGFGGMALLPPNETLAAQLPDDWVDALPAEGDVGTNEGADLQLGELPLRMANVIQGWVATAIAGHASADPNLIELTNAPLLVAELARRRATPVDLAQSFSAGDVRLGWLEITLLTAGMRSMLVGVEAAGIASQPVEGGMVLAMSRDEFQTSRAPLAQDTPCDNLKRLLDSRVPLASTVIKSFVGDQIKGFIQNFVNSLFGETSTFAQNVGRAFKVLSVMFKVQALIMLYSEAAATVEMDPASYHKPDGGVLTAAATVTVGIPDGAWEAAQQSRQLSPFATALRTCARFIGLPVWQDLVDAGDAIDGWSVGWTIRQGSDHVRFNAREEFWGPGAVPGRQEKPISRVNDHSGNDILGYEVLPERREDHPGTEMSQSVELCAEVYPKAPPNGFSTILSAGTAGASLAGGGSLGLVAVIANLLTAWVSTVVPIKGCGHATVSYHIVMPGAWHGTVTANTEVQESSTSTVSEYVGPNWGTTVSTHSARTSIDVWDRFYLGGTDEQIDMGYIALDGRQYTNGAATDESHGKTLNGVSGTGCTYNLTEDTAAGGGWFFDVEASGTINLFSDGRYTISFYGRESEDEVVIPGKYAKEVTPLNDCEDIGSQTRDSNFYPSPIVGKGSNSTVEGQLDPENPGNILEGQITITNYDLSTTVITWNIVHDGPIPLPFR